MRMKIYKIVAFFIFIIISNANSQTTPDQTTFSNLSIVNPIESEKNIYQQIYDEFQTEYQNIGLREASKILGNNDLSIVGGLNSIGFSFHKPFAQFSLSVDRNLAPDLFDEKRWIVTDKFTINIDASKVIGNLAEKKIIDLTQKNLAAFAGLVFKRTFTWVHFANSYKEGLTTHFEKLFLPFNAVMFKNISHLEQNEMIFKEDSISIKTGGMVSIPVYAGIINAEAGAMAMFTKLSRTEIISSPNLESKINNIHISYEKSKIASVGVSVGVQADFLKILKLTILSYDFNYEMDSSYKMYLNFDQNFLADLNSENPIMNEIGQILKNREGDLNILAPYIISEEKKKSQALEHKYKFLLFGGMKDSKTQQIEVTTNAVVKTFFRHYYEKIKYTEDIVSKLFSSVVYALTNSEPNTSKLVSDSKKVTIEYDSEKNLLETHNDLNIGDTSNNEQKLTMTFSADFQSKKSTGFFGRKFRNKGAYYLSKYSGVDPLVIDMLNRDYLVAPMEISGQYQVNTQGIRYLNSLSVSNVFDHLDGLCKEYPRTKILNFRNLFNNCRRSLQNDYIDYYKDLSHNKITDEAIGNCESNAKRYIFSPSKKRAAIKECLSQITLKDKNDWVEIPLWPLKNFSNNIVNSSNSKLDYYNLFGKQNVFFYGAFNAKTSDGHDFTTNFHEGVFSGLGAVDNFMRLENLRSPASVVVD